MPSGKYKRTPKMRENYRKGQKGKPKPWIKGHPMTSTARRKIGEAKKGDRNPNWKGGISSLNILIRSSYQYRQWRSDVFTRDIFTCQKCRKEKSGKLRAHHIKSLKQIMREYKIQTLQQAIECEELFNINNGITLCKDCHFLLHSLFGQEVSEEQLREFLNY